VSFRINQDCRQTRLGIALPGRDYWTQEGGSNSQIGEVGGPIGSQAASSLGLLRERLGRRGAGGFSLIHWESKAYSKKGGTTSHGHSENSGEGVFA